MKSYINVEIKAKCFHPEKVEAFLFSAGAHFEGVDHQTDIYFNCPNGRLKLRSGNIENNLIFYNRPNEKGPKQSHFQLMPVANAADLQRLLTNAFGIKVKVVKTRRIYFLGNIKVHLDELEGLGNFVEIEAGNLTDTSKTVEKLYAQCNNLMQHFGIEEHHLIDKSYSDMLLGQTEGL